MKEEERTYLIKVSMDTGKYPDLVLRQLIKNIPGWFPDLTSGMICEILRSEAEALTVNNLLDDRISYEATPKKM